MLVSDNSDPKLSKFKNAAFFDMFWETFLRQIATPKPQRRLIAVGFLGLPVLTLGTILVQVVKGSASFTVFLAADQGVTYSFWILPMFGFLAWSCNFLAGVWLNAIVDGRSNHLTRTLWWSGIGIEVLCLATTFSYL